MTTNRVSGYPVLIIGAGRGGTALLEMFLNDNLVDILAIADINTEAPGIRLAKNHGIQTFTDAVEALQACKDYPDCIVYNLSHDDTIADEAFKIFGDRRVASGLEVQLFWQMVTNLKQTKDELEKSQQQLQSIISNVMDGIITVNESSKIQGFNPAAEDIFGYSQQEVMDKNLSIVIPESDRDKFDSYINRYLKKGRSKILGMRGLELIAMRKNGETFPMEVSASEMILGGNRYYIGIIRDITERKQAEQKIAHMAHHDHLTDLPNRALLVEVLSHSISLAKRNRHKVGLLFIDLDGFKAINDTLGHDAGDLLLKNVSKRIKETIRDSDMVARVGGDEFILVLDKIESDEQAMSVAKKIIASLSKPFDLSGKPGCVGGSIGISIYPNDSKNPTQLLKQADEAMYLAKQSGKCTARFYREVVAKQ
jgi:diguanylate cyclase (GGDEF)-like protein/PAS domain S-box-containing protein